MMKESSLSFVLCVAVAAFVAILNYLNVLYFFPNLYFLTFGIVLIILCLNWRNVVIISKTYKRDIRFSYRVLESLIRTKILEKNEKTLVDLFEETVKRDPHKICFYFEDEKWTFQDVEDYSNRIAHVFQDAGYRKGDVIALLMSNSAVYVCVWIGLAKLGAITALINTNLRQESLVHTLKSGMAKAIIYTAEFAKDLEDISQEIGGLRKYQSGGELLKDALSLDDLFKKAEKSPIVPKDTRKFKDPLLYIYTSGTTGLPKAAIITNSKCIMLAIATWHCLGFRHDDVMYNPLPLYHTSGGVVAIICSLVKGFPVVIRKKFSASQYFTDCQRYNCTIGFYIGEMCRYILAQPARPEDRQHKMRMIMGNGMRTTVWREFVERFNIPQVCELYGSTEGNTNLINVDKTIGAVGFLPQILPKWLLPIYLIRVDENGQPIRGNNGLCIRCKPGEPGTFVGVISSHSTSQEFAGYVGGENENKKKILTDVFRKGDKVFWSGDLLVFDELGYLYFKDRLGDTFRWKGENVSTAEVEGILSKATNNLDVIVYGVEVGQNEGRAGMATVVDPAGQINIEELSKEIDQKLPVYARPLFIRIAKEVDLTGTFKLKKTDLQKEGFNPKLVTDKLYFRKGSSLVPLTEEIYEGLVSGNIRV